MTVVVVQGHFEVTLSALVGEWPRSERVVAGVVNTLLARVSSTTATAA